MLTAIPANWDWKNPDYAVIFRDRIRRLEWLRAQGSGVIEDLKAYYRDDNYADFISDWGVTFDPRLADRGLPTLIPFLIFPKQREWIAFVLRKWREHRRGISEKSRDWGLSYGAVALSCSMCALNNGMQIGFGSRKAEYVDSSKDPKSLFWKARLFMEHLPQEFAGGYVPWRDSTHMRMWFPDTQSVMTGEAGDQIGRGDRSSMHFVDEAAYLERPELVEHSLSQTTNCRIDMSSVNGMNNPFAKNRHEGKIEVFVCDWRDDPRKDDAWYAKQCDELDPVTVAQEIDRDYLASVEGVVIPGVWARALVDAHKVLGIADAGQRHATLDVADEGRDKNAFCGTQGVEIDYLEERSGKGSDIFETVEWAFLMCDAQGARMLRYDADGLGAGVRGDARVINARRQGQGLHAIRIEPYRGSEAVFDPEGIVEGTMATGDGKGRMNKDYFLNRKAQNWWSFRRRAQKTYRWIVEGIRCDPSEIVSIAKAKVPLWSKAVTELSQATFKINEVGKIVINKTPQGMKSPNLADAIVQRFAVNEGLPLEVPVELLQRIKSIGTLRGRRGGRRWRR